MGFLQEIYDAISGKTVAIDLNRQMKIVSSLVPSEMGGIRIFGENDSGSLTGSPKIMSPEISTDFRVRSGVDTYLFKESFNYLSQNTDIWKYNNSTMTMIQSGGFLLLNSNTSGTSGAFASLQTWQYFGLKGASQLYKEFIFSLTSAPQAGQVFELGIFLASGSIAPADGIFLRVTNTGIVGVVTYNGIETATPIQVDINNIVMGKNYHLTITSSEREVEFWVDNDLISTIEVPEGNAIPYLSSSLPCCVQSRNTGTVSGLVAQMKIGHIIFSLGDMNINKMWPDQASGSGLSGYQGQSGGVMGQLSVWSNTAEPTAATATNTTAALGSGFGGLFKANAMATSATDLIIQSYQNPLGGINQTAKSIYIKGIMVDVVNQVVPVATTPFSFAVALAFGHTTVSLATAETGSFVNATTKSPRRVPIGNLFLPIGAIAGEPSREKIYVKFETPIVVNPGHFIQTIIKVLSGTATPTETLLFSVGFDAYQE